MVWKRALSQAADASRVKHYLELLKGTAASEMIANATAEQARILVALLSGSRISGDLLVRHPEWVGELDPADLQHPRRIEGLRRDVAGWLEPLLEAGDRQLALRRLREFNQSQLVRIAARDLARLGSVEEIIGELSHVADICLGTVWRLCRLRLEDRLGKPHHQTTDGRWVETEACVLGMGKLGGQELNYSSDVDVLFVYDEEGHVFREPPTRRTKPRPTISSHEFFNRLAEAFIKEVSQTTRDGTLYRIDLRLRPEGNSGPLTRSLESYENYYAQHGQTWERMMLIKARCVAGSESLAGEFLETVQSFRYPRAVGKGLLQEIAGLKDRIESEVVKTGELDRNVKLGRGGIREIEFLVQSFQVMQAGRSPFLQTPQTLPCLEKLVRYKLLPESDATCLRGAYCFLRDVEHRLQMDAGLQTHTIPKDAPARERLGKLMGFKGWKAFSTALKGHTSCVRKIFDQLLREKKVEPEADLPVRFEGAEAEWAALLEAHSFKDPAKAIRMLREFVQGPGYIHVSARSSSLARRLLPKLFELCLSKDRKAVGDRLDKPVLSDPDRVLTRLDSYIAAYGARAVLLETWTSQPLLFELLLLLFDRSEFLAELAISTPDLVDDLVVSGRLRQRKTSEKTLSDLMHGIDDADQYEWIRKYQQAELLRIGLRDILALAGPQQTLQEITALADACLQYAVAVVCQRNRVKKAPFAVIALGKQGGNELTFGSDLDIVFVASDKAKSLPRLHKMAAAVMDLLSRRTDLGIAFEVDARLRPDGEKSPLVNTISAHENYYRQRAQLWELQAISRVRAVAGDPKLGGQFEVLAGHLTDFRGEGPKVAAYSMDWKTRMHQMRMRIQTERTPKGMDELAIKTGQGGLIDAEFTAQALCLENGWQEPNTLAALERAQQEGILPMADELIVNYLRLRRVEGILRRWSYEAESVLPSAEEAYARVAVRCGFSSAGAFRKSLADYRSAIRKAYLAYFRPASKE